MRAIPREPCLALIHEFEQGPKGGFAPTPYNDPVGKPTIGWGHLIKPGEHFTEIDETTADALAIDDLGFAATGVCSALPLMINKLTDNQYAALIDLTYNIGVGAFRASSAALLVESGAMHLVPAAIEKWVYGTVNGVHQVLPGLVRRRKAEVMVWNAP